MKLVDDAKRAWRWLSMQCMGAALALQLTWDSIPPELKASIPPRTLTYITVGLLVLGLGGRLVKQTKDDAQ